MHEEKNSQREKLFNLAADPAESKNLAKQEPDRFGQLRAKLDPAMSDDSVAKDQRREKG